jgi:5-methyltetrahydropteroyltriglutamate--homocysteine methyltransferase
MVLTYDVGSVPFSGDFEKFIRGSRVPPLLNLLHYSNYAADRKFFEDKVMEGFIDKIRVGIAVPNYPQFRDMDEMFLSSISGVAKAEGGYKVVDRIAVSEGNAVIPEIAVIKEKAGEIGEIIGDSLKVKICITGPYTLASLFSGRESSLFAELGRVMAKFVEENVFNGKFGGVALVAVDEPVFGLFDDPLLDYGQSGKETLLKAWETVFHEIRSGGAKSILHLHSTVNDLFWQVKHLDIVESHVNDLLYSSSKTRDHLERWDKFIKASICVTDFDTLVRKSEEARDVKTDLGQRVADVWTAIRKKVTSPMNFLEDTDMMVGRLKRMLTQYEERVTYAGSECGFRSFPTYESAMECLRRVSEAAIRVGHQQ